MEHKSVLLEETIDLLNIKPDGIYVDGTLGRGGHSKVLLSKLETGHLYAFDKDEQALVESKENLKEYLDHVTMIHGDYSTMKEELEKRGVTKVDGVMMDLGVSSPQFDDPSRGFSYRFDARLDMRMDQSQPLSAYEIVNEYSFEELVRVLVEYGEERNAKRIVRGIERQRQIAPIETTFQLVDVIKASLPDKVLSKKGHPAKKTFQALRIEVNHELDSLKEGLMDACSLLDVGGRCAIITFQSLEDRMVKQYFKELSSVPYIDPKLPIKEEDMEQADYELVNRKAIIATKDEQNENRRSHSAKLRGIERVKVSL